MTPIGKEQLRMRPVGPYWNDEHETRPVVVQGAAHPVVGHGTVMQGDSGGRNLSRGSPFRMAGGGDSTSGTGYQVG